MIVEALRLGCDEFHLDSGLAVDRLPAHRLYFRTGMRIASFHFTMLLAHRDDRVGSTSTAEVAP